MSEETNDKPAGSGRAARRLGVSFPVEYSGLHVRGTGTICDISSSGALIEKADPPLLAGGEIAIRFSFSDDSLPIELRAVVVRETEQGFAVRFSGIDRRLRQVLSLAVSRSISRASPEGKLPEGTSLLDAALSRNSKKSA